MKKINSIVLFVIMLNIGYSQSPNSFLNEIPFETALTEDQQAELEKITDNPLLHNHHLITIEDLVTYSESNEDGIVQISLSFLPETDIQFIAAEVKFEDEENYYWYGFNNMSYEEEEQFKHSTLSITNFNGTVSGNITFDHHSFELHDLSNGIICISELDMSEMGPDECATFSDGTTANKTTAGPCGTETTRILVVFDNDALSVNSNIPSLAQACVNNLNTVWARSDIQNTAILAAAVNIPFGRSNDIINDLNDLKTSTSIAWSRDFHEADIVVLMVGQPYGGINGIAANIGGGETDAFCIVSATTAISGRLTFSHEITHLYGGYHDDTNVNTNHRGRCFNTGVLWTVKRRTLLAQAGANDCRIENISNPDVKFFSRNTGTSSRNNAAVTKSMINTIANFRLDPALFLNATVNWGNIYSCDDQTTAIVTATCGEPPYSYQWQKSFDGLNWINLGTTDSEQITIPPPTIGAYAYVQYRVHVTDTANNIVTRSRSYNVLCYGQHHRPTSNLNQESKEEVAIFPNPSEGNFTLSLSDDFIGLIKIHFVDMAGKVAYSEEFNNASNLVQLDNVSNLAKSIYTVKVVNEKNHSKSFKVVIE